MSDHFVQAALDQIWCAPEMDKQGIFKPARVSPSAGAILRLRIMFIPTELPTPGERYHVFQFGQIPPALVGIETDLRMWVKGDELANTSELKLNVYTDDGIEIPKSLIHFRIIEGNNVIMAVRYATENKLPNLGKTAIYTRFYSNAFMSSARSSTLDDFVHTHSIRINDLQDAADFINLHNSFKNMTGDVMFFKNGRLCELPTVGQTVIGDYWEFHYDASIYKRLEFPVSELESYLSVMDTTRRYIIHPNKADIDIDSIFYRDDLDFYVQGDVSVGNCGLYLHRNLERNVRMLTHNDYAIRVEHVDDLAEAMSLPPGNTTVVLYLRHSGFERPLVYERHFIHELYKLDDKEIIATMARKGLGVEYWAADCLEASYYTKIMRRTKEPVTEDEALKAFGYGGASIQVQDSPINVNGEFSLPVPIGYRGEVLVMEQDYENKRFGAYYAKDMQMHEAIPFARGIYDYRLASETSRNRVYVDMNNFSIDGYSGFSCYIAPKQAGSRSGDWVDVTADESKWVVENGTFIWLVEMPLYHVAVVPGDYSSIHSFTSDNIRDLVIDLKTHSNMLGAPVPVAEDIIVVGGHVLTEDIDYVVNNGLVRVVNRDVINIVGEQEIWVVRVGSGHNRSRTEIGGVRYNSLSRDGNYDLHEGLIMQCVSDGKIISRDRLAFAENDEASQYLRSGAPYMLKYYRGPIADVPWFKVSDLRNDYDKTAEEIGHYLSALLEEPERTFPDAIANKHMLYSPFIDKIVRDIDDGTLIVTDKPLTDTEIVAMLSGYTSLLAYEPCLTDHYNGTWITVAPTAVDKIVTISNHAFYLVGRAIAIWLENRIDIHPYIGIES